MMWLRDKGKAAPVAQWVKRFTGTNSSPAGCNCFNCKRVFIANSLHRPDITEMLLTDVKSQVIHPSIQR